MPEKAMLAKIHIAKKELALTDEVYRDILHLHFQVETAAKLNNRQATVLLNLFRSKGWQPKQRVPNGKPRLDGAFIKIPPGPAAQQQRKVLAMWNELGYAMSTLHARVKKQFHVDRFEWLDDNRSLTILITDLQHRIDTSRRLA